MKDLVKNVESDMKTNAKFKNIKNIRFILGGRLFSVYLLIDRDSFITYYRYYTTI